MMEWTSAYAGEFVALPKLELLFDQSNVGRAFASPPCTSCTANPPKTKNPATEIAGFFLSENLLRVLTKAAQNKKASDSGQ
jgi:hypothetical protein